MEKSKQRNESVQQGRHGFQSMGPLFNSMEDVGKPDPAKCDVEGCDERLVLTEIQTSSTTMEQGSQTPGGPDPPPLVHCGRLNGGLRNNKS